MADPPSVSISDLADGAADAAPPLADDGRLAAPLVVVALDGPVPRATLERAVARARGRERLLVGVVAGEVAVGPRRDEVTELARALDLTLVARTHDEAGVAGAAGTAGVTGRVDRAWVEVPDADEELTALAEVADRTPQAAMVLGQVLRAGEDLPVGAALNLESFAYSTLLGGPEFHRWLESRGPRPLPPPAERPVLVRRDGHRLRITLNRPERRNAYGRALRDALTDALHVAALDPEITEVLLDGAGPAFCSGGDLAEFGTAPDPVTGHFVRTLAGAGRLVHDLAARMEARVHGDCVGAGIEVPAFAARVVADPAAAFRLPEVGMGLIPGAGGTVSIPRRIGRWRTAYLALTGRSLSARAALEWGLVDEVRPAAGLIGS